MKQFTICGLLCAFVAVTMATSSSLALADEPTTKPAAVEQILRAGAASVDISPTNLPVIVNGNFFPVRAEKVNDPLHARALVLDDGAELIALCVVDSCVVPRELCDQIKKLVQESCGIRPERVMISATHTHSAPSLMRAHASEVDPHYPQFLVVQVATAIERAKANLAPAEVGWAVVDDYQHTHCRQWIFRPDRMKVDPFGEFSVRANMHPKHEDPDCIGPEGPVDPGLSLLSVRGRDGRPIALLANYSMHYYGTPAVSADYFGRFAAHVERMIGQAGSPEFVAMMSQGTSGDLMWLDYSAPRVDPGMDNYAKAVAEVAVQAYRDISSYRSWAPIAMRERELHLRMRVPNEKRLAWARNTVANLAGGPPKTLGDIYAGEQIFLHEHPERDIKLQALRIGGLGIAMIPCEVFGITGLKIKAQSPLETNFVIELANGEDGYIPPPEEHKLGGYTTWACRTAGLEEQAEPKIVENILQMLEEVSGRSRRKVVEEHGEYARAVQEAKPIAYWRMNEWSGPTATSALAAGPTATYEDGVVFYLDGPQSAAFSGAQKNRAAHFAGGRMTAQLKASPANYSIELWAWNGLPDDAREVTGYLAACGAENSAGTSDCLAIGGTQGNQRGKLVLHSGDKLDAALVGQTVLTPRSWHHVVLVREGRRATLYCDGKLEATGEVEPWASAADGHLYFAGRPGNRFNLEGKLDEVAVYDRALSAAEVEAHHRAAGRLGETKTGHSAAK